MKKIIKAVLNVDPKDAVEVNNLAIKVGAALAINGASFPGIATGLTKLNTDQAKLSTLMGTAKGNKTIKDQRILQSELVYADLQALAAIVNSVASNNLGLIDLSGFPNSANPTPQPIPNQIVIKRIVDAKTALTAKIYILSLKQKRLNYTVRMTTVANAPADDASWKVVLQTTSSRKLIIPNLVRNQDVYFDVNASNARGVGKFSDAMVYSAR
jgi:hypothetical protein